MSRSQIVVEDDKDRFAARTDHRDERQALGAGVLALAEHLRDLGITEDAALPRQVRVSVKTAEGDLVLRAEVDREHAGAEPA